MALPLFAGSAGGGKIIDRASVVVVAACLLGASCALAGDGPASGKVVDVYDGDSITVESDSIRHKCRLLGIDAPEMSYARLWTEMDKVSKYAPPGASDSLRAAREAFRKWAEVMEAHAREARRALAELVMDRTVRLACDTKGKRKDRYHSTRPSASSGLAHGRPTESACARRVEWDPERANQVSESKGAAVCWSTSASAMLT